ncbi:MAG: hypothetical protein ABEH43_05165 [Flavobacteriales bacterium]
MSWKTDILLKQEERLFHTNDLALLWGITNKNTLYTSIRRYIQRGILYRIHKGLYSTISPEQINKYYLMAKAIHNYCYLSTEKE